MLHLVHIAGFDAIAVTILLTLEELEFHKECLSLPWNERWTIWKEKTSKSEGQIAALGHDLWLRIAETLEGK